MENSKELEFKRKIESLLYPNESVHKLGDEPITYYADILDTIGFEPKEFNSYQELYHSEFSNREPSKDSEVKLNIKETLEHSSNLKEILLDKHNKDIPTLYISLSRQLDPLKEIESQVIKSMEAIDYYPTSGSGVDYTKEIEQAENLKFLFTRWDYNEGSAMKEFNKITDNPEYNSYLQEKQYKTVCKIEEKFPIKFDDIVSKVLQNNDVEKPVSEFTKIDINTLSKKESLEQNGSVFVIYSTMTEDITNTIRRENEKECWASRANSVDMTSLWEKIDSIKNEYLWFCELSDIENEYVDNQISDLFNKVVDECIKDNIDLRDRLLWEHQEEEMEVL